MKKTTQRVKIFKWTFNEPTLKTTSSSSTGLFSGSLDWLIDVNSPPPKVTGEPLVRQVEGSRLICVQHVVAGSVELSSAGDDPVALHECSQTHILLRSER